MSESSGDGYSTSEERLQQKAKKRKRSKPAYCKKWENLPEFKYWLTKDPKNEYNAMCTTCKKIFVSEISTIKRHGKTTKHKELQQQISEKQKAVMNRFLQSKGKLPILDYFIFNSPHFQYTKF